MTKITPAELQVAIEDKLALAEIYRHQARRAAANGDEYHAHWHAVEARRHQSGALYLIKRRRVLPPARTLAA